MTEAERDELAGQYNARLALTGRRDVEWTAAGGQFALQPVLAAPRQAAAVQPADVDRLNSVMRKLGCRTRYRIDGSDYQLDAGAPDPAENPET